MRLEKLETLELVHF